MRRAFPWLFATFGLAFLLFILVQVLVLAPGIRESLRRYEEAQQTEFESIARSILINPLEQTELSLRYTNPFFVFSADGNLLYTNRGKGKAIPEEDLLPVEYDRAVIGYYYAGEMRFIDNEANKIFLVSLIRLALGSLIASVAIGFAVSLFASRRFARPLATLQSDIASIESRARVDARRFPITELTDISASIEKLSTILADEERYKRQWMQDIAHDLRTPVSGLRSQIEGMRDGVLDPSAERFTRNLREVERLEQMIAGIATLYTVENAKILEVEPFAAEAFVGEILSSHEMRIEEKGLRLDVSVEVESISGDRALLVRAVDNLITNAIAYTGSGGRISIELRRDTEGTSIVVADNGPGIPADQLERIFNRFYRGEYARNTTGTGLGLNIAKTIVERHGGSLSVVNRTPTGAQFTVTLPGSEPGSRGEHT